VAAPRPPRLGLVEDLLEHAEPAVREHVAQVADRFERAGARVHPVRLPEPFQRMVAVQLIIMQSEAGTVHGRLHAEHAELYPPRLRAIVETGQLLPAGAYLRAQRLRHRLRLAVQPLLADADALLMPTASNTAPEPSTTGDTRFQAIWSVLGVPALSMPSGRDADGLPFSLQLVAAPWREDALLAAARWCEQQLDPLGVPPL
jgi:Asp-tRNA(Asn)/Glu-tRNA(Gln) amidotransferase A subunit family amidase